MQPINTAPSEEKSVPRCPKCDSEIIRVKQAEYNRDTGKRIRRRFRLNIAWGMLSAWMVCSLFALLGALTEDDQSILLVPVVMTVLFGVILALPGYLILKRLKRTDTGELLLYSCSTCFHRWRVKVEEPLLAEQSIASEDDLIAQDDIEATEPALGPPDNEGVLIDIVEETVDQDIMSPGSSLHRTNQLQTAEGEQQTVSDKPKLEETPKGPRIPQVEIAYPLAPEVSISTLRILILSFIGSLIGVVLLSVLIPVALNSGMDDLLFAVWLLPAIIAREIVRNFGPKPNLDGYPVQTMVMLLTISLVSSLGILPLIDEYDLKTWGPHVFLFVSAAILTFSGKSNIQMYPYCRECDVFLKPEIIRLFEITETERILEHLESREFSKVSRSSIKLRAADVTRLNIYACPDCGEGMILLSLNGELDGNAYHLTPVYSEKRNEMELSELLQVMKASSK